MADKDEPPPQVGATFLPGGLDDFYMPAHAPDLVSPVPQRIMHELPGQMSDRLELDATSPSVAVGSQQQLNTAESRTTSNTPHVSLPQAQMQTQTTPLPIMVASNTTSQLLPLQDPASGKYHQQHSKPTPADEPRFAAFPKLHHTPGHVPEADEDHEAALGRARPAVLISTDPEMQLAWAQDALRYVDIVLEHDIRMAALGQPKTAGKTVYELRNDAMSIVDFLADQSHPKADFLRGTWLEFGKFEHREDKVEAFRCYKRSASKGYARSEYRMGMQFESTSEAMKALQHYQAGEALGDAASCYRLGMMTLLGQLGQAQDYGKGLRLIRNAADGADENAPQGAYVYGMLLARELPQIKIPEIFLAFDIVSARQYIEKSAFLGFSRAMVKMGSAYELCLLGCDFNPTLSLHYNALAALRGETEAEMAISKWFLCGYEGLFHKNEEMAFWYARRAADSGLATAEFAMGYYFEVGVYVPTSVSKALDWYSKAASQGNKDAQDRIAGINSSQTLSKKDHQNVAVSRIQSQYGSRRGNRPERFGRPVQQLADIPDESLQVHRPATVGLPAPAPALPAVSQAFQFRPPTAASQRSQTVTPYPVDDRPPSVAPYPLDDGPPVGRIVPVGGTYAANRPSEIQNGPNTYSAPGPGRGQFLDPAVGRRPLPVNTP